MSTPRPSMRLARWSTFVMAGATLLLVLATNVAFLALEHRREEGERARQEAELARTLALWEDLQLDRIEAALQAAAARVGTADAGGAVPQAPPGTDAVYAWRPGADGRPGVLLHPRPGPVEDIPALLADPCMQRAAAGATPDAPREAIAAGWAACADRPAPVALLAVSRAADQYLAAGQPQAALDALLAPDVPLDVDATTRAALGVATVRGITRQLQVAEARAALGQEQAAADTLVALGEAILELRGEELAAALPFLDYPVLADLRAAGRTDAAADLARRARPVRRSLAGFRAVQARVDRPEEVPAAATGTTVAMPAGPAPLSLRAEPLGDRRYLLAWARLGEDRVVAVQLDPAAMLAELTADPDLRVLDATGHRLATAGGADPADVAAGPQLTVPFGPLLPALRLARPLITDGAAATRTPRLLLLATTFLVLALSGFTVLARIRADREQQELWERQQGFVHRVSHELKTPLAGVKVLAEMIELGMISDERDLEQTAQRIISEVSRMEDRVNEILALARRPEIHEPEPLDIREMAAHLAEIWAPRFEQKGARLSVELQETGEVVGDRQLIRDAIGNLLDNALKYLREDRPGVVRLRTGAGDRWVVVEVADNGIGVPESMRKAVFGRFTRVEGAGRGKAGGHGLGLSFVAEAVDRHGGKVECRDGIAGGARFIIRLRRKR